MNELNIIPKPVSGVIEGGSIDLAIVKTIALMHNSDDEKRTAIFLKELLRPVNTFRIQPNKKLIQKYIRMSSFSFPSPNQVFQVIENQSLMMRP